MRKLLKWVVVTVGIAAFARWLRGRKSGSPDAAAEVEDPADELRRKLAESRTEDEAEAPAAAPAATVEERRSAIHEHGRSAVDEMTSSSED